MNNQVSAIEKSSLEQELGEILAFLKPPQQQYDVLADRAWSFLSRSPAKPSVERALATYFELFARGYAEWQTCYDYHLIHEYFYGALLRALRAGEGSISADFKHMLGDLTASMIAYTWCENSIITNNAKALSFFAARAFEFGNAARRALALSSLAPSLHSPIEDYLVLNTTYFRGLHMCAEMYLATLEGKAITSEQRSCVDQSLQFLESQSWELFTELRGHYTNVQRHEQLRAQIHSELLVDEASMLLRAIGYADEDLIAALFSQCLTSDAKTMEGIKRSAREEFGLPIISIRGANLHDLFETSLGREYLDEIIFEFPTDDHAFSFSIREGNKVSRYYMETLQIRVSRLGTVAVEFGIPIKNASVSHVRVLESLIAPHAGRFDFIWRDSPSIDGRGTVNYVDFLQKCQQWVKQIHESIPEIESPVLAQMGTLLEDWREAFYELSNCLAGRNTINPDDRLPKVYGTFQEYLTKMHNLADELTQEQVLSSSQEIIEAGKVLFPRGVHYSKLIDIADNIFQRFGKFMCSRLAKENTDTKTQDRLKQPTLDTNIGWQTILNCGKVILVEYNGQKQGSSIDLDNQEIIKHPFFKGLIIQNREARSSLDDWLFVEEPKYRNLAVIRSHESDSFYAGENRAFIYLSDDPQYLVNQYVETAKLVSQIRTITLSYNTKAKDIIEDLQSFLHEFEHGQKDGKSRLTLRMIRTRLWDQLHKIEIFRLSANKRLDLVTQCTFSKYQDHSDLMRAILEESSMNIYRESLQHKLDTLDHFQEHLNNLIQRRIDEHTQSNENMLAWFLFALTILSIPSAIAALDPIITSWTGGMISPEVISQGTKIFTVVVFVGGIVLGILVWQRRQRL